jgi:hypothetical protein
MGDALEWYFRKTKDICPTCIFPADIQYFSGRKLMEFGLKTQCLDGTLNKRNFFLFIHIGERDERSSPCLIYLDQYLSCFSALVGLENVQLGQNE